MWNYLKKSLFMLLALTLLLGLVYPLLITGVSRVLFPHQSGGSLVYRDGKPVGSQLVGQKFSSPRYFQGRPSAAGKGYDPQASGGSNLGPTNHKLIADIKSRVEAVRRNDGLPSGAPVPSDLVTASGSGLDPDISPAAALLQVPRVARARRLPEARVRELVNKMVEPRPLGFLGEPRVNLLKLNLALDRM